jgi:uncharacterized protein involved in outer membrane biogenesis
VLAIALVAAPIALLLIDANILRAPAARYLSATLDRHVAINGDLRVRLFKHPRVEVNGVVIDNAEWGSRPQMLQLEHGAVQIRLLPLLAGRVVIPRVELIKPDLLLEVNEDGTPNWQFGRKRPEPAEPSGPVNLPEIGSLSIHEGRVQFRDPAAKSDVALELDSSADADSNIRFAGHGSLRARDFELDGRADSLLELSEAGKPYRLKVKARAGDTRAMFDGTLVPLKLETIDGRLELSGKDLSKLYPLVPVALPWTSSYRISGHFLRKGNKFALEDFKGVVGGSDVGGKASLDLTRKKPFFSADVTSQRLDYKDLAGFLGAPPPSKGERRPVDQERQRDVQQTTGKALPLKPYDLTRLRVLDADVRFKAASILSGDLPLDNMITHVKLDDATLTLDPLDFGVAGGHVTSKVTLDARSDVIATKLQATVRNLEAKALLPALKRDSGSAGKIGGRAQITAKGNSIAAMAGSANGEVALIMSQGRASTLTLVLVNLDLANAARYLIRGDPNAPVHCGVVIAELQNGVAVPRTFVVDSTEEKITGEGTVDLKQEQYDLRLKAQSKRVSLVALRGPIRVGGTFKHPQVRPETGPLVARVGAAVALGIVATPLAALIPLVDLGTAKGANCSALIGEAEQTARKIPAQPPAPDPGKRPAAAPPRASEGGQPAQRH